MPLDEPFEVTDCVPRLLGEGAVLGSILAGPLPLIDYLCLQTTFERVGPFGIAVRGRAHSTVLFTRKPLRSLDGATIAVTSETSTTECVLRLLLEKRYRIIPKAYLAGEDRGADALLLIGDEALRFRQTNRQYPYEIDLGFEWWMWQHVPLVFAVWAVRKDAEIKIKRDLERSLSRTLGINQKRFPEIAQEYSKTLGVPAQELERYLSNFIYRLSQPEEEGITRFKALVHEHHLL